MRKIVLFIVSLMIVTLASSVNAEEVKPDCRFGNNSEMVKTFGTTEDSSGTPKIEGSVRGV